MPTIEGSLRRIWTKAGVPTDGVAGTHVNQIAAGDLLIDTSNKTLYQNTNTSASPTYTLKASTGALLGVLAAEMAANGTSTANTLGISAAAAPIDHVHKIGVHDHSDNTKGSAIVEAGITAASLTGLVAKVVANDATTGGIPIVYAIAIAGGAAASKDITLDHKIRIIDVWAQHTGGGGEASDTIQVLSTGDAITDAMVWSGADNVIVRAASINDGNATIIAGGKIRVTTTDDDTGGDVGAGVVYVEAIRSA
jgi:hypothetical protein